MIVDVTPRVYTFRGDYIELGTVRYIIDASRIFHDGEANTPWTQITPTIPLGPNWNAAKIEFKVELKSEQLQPTAIPVITEGQANEG